MSNTPGGKPKDSRSPATSLSLEVEHKFPGHDRQLQSARPSAKRLDTAGPSSPGESQNIAAHRPRSSAREADQGGIFNLLQAPTLRRLLPNIPTLLTSQKPPTSKDIPPVTLTAIPHVDDSVFEDYLSHFEGLFNTFQRLTLESGNSAQVQQHAPTPLSTIPSVYFEENFHLENPRIFDVVSEHAEIVRQLRSAIEDGAKGSNGISANVSPQPARNMITTNAILQEKLSWYVDTVEVHLTSLISQKAGSFLDALGLFRELQAEAADCVTRVQELRANLAHLDKEMVTPGLKIITMKSRWNNVRKLSEATRQLQYVVNGVSHCEELVDSEHFEIAIVRVLNVEQLAHGTLNPEIDDSLDWLLPSPFTELTDLRRLSVFAEVSKAMDQLRQRIAKGYELRLLKVLLNDLHQHVSSVPPRDTLARWDEVAKRARSRTESSLSTPAYMMNAERLREDLIPVLQGLRQSQCLAAAVVAFRETIFQEMKSIIRKHLPSSTEDDNESIASTSTRAGNRHSTQREKSSILSRNLQALGPEDAQAFFISVYCEVGETLRRLGVQVKLLYDVASNMDKVSSNELTSPQSPGSMHTTVVSQSSLPTELNSLEIMTEALDVSTLFSQAVDKAQSHIVKVLRVRTEQTTHLELADFLSYFALNRRFVDECEAVSGHTRAAFKDIVNHHIQAFLSHTHDAQKQRLARWMESEKWERIDLKPESTMILKRILLSATTDPPEWLSYMDTRHAGQEEGKWNSQTNDMHADPTETTLATNQDKQGPVLAVIEAEEFMLIESATFTLGGIEQYAILLVSVPSMASDVSTALLDYLRLYNSRTQQLILGGGAKLTAGLTTINTKHLALASQSLSFFITLVPYLREFVRRRSSIASHSLVEYDRLKLMFQDHQSSIHDKLIDIMSSRTTVCVRAMEKVDWNDEEEVEKDVSPHMKTLTNEALLLQRVLNRYLPEVIVKTIVDQVFRNYKEQLSNAFENVEIQTEAAQARLLRDAELLESKLGKIDKELGAHMISIVKAKQVTPLSKPNPSLPPADGTPA